MSLFCSYQVLKGIRPAVLSATSPSVSQNGILGSLFVRYKGKQRIKEAKTQIDKSKRFIAKKDKKKSKFIEEIGEKSQILAEKPVDNVWVRKFYPNPKFSIEEALKKHKDFAQPAMLDNLDGIAFMDMTLDFRTKKQTKFMKNIKSTLLLPHRFPFGVPPSILVFCKEEEHTNLALSLGAKHAGSPTEVIKMLENGVLNPKDFTHVLATADCGTEIMPARSFLRENFPQKAKGSMGTDLNAMWTLFFFGHTYESHNVTESQGKLQVPLGQLSQPVKELADNFEAYIQSVCKHRSVALGPFIQSISILAPPSPEEFVVKVEDYVPGYTNEEVDSDDDEDTQEGIN